MLESHTLVTNLPFGINDQLKGREVQHVYQKFERFLLEHFDLFKGVYVITLDNSAELNFVNRDKLAWTKIQNFSSAALKLGVFKCHGKVKVKHIDDPYKIISTNPNKKPSKGEITRKINFSVKTNAPLKLSSREQRFMKKHDIKSKFNLDRIDKIKINSKKSQQLVDTLKRRKFNIFLKQKKAYDDQKFENIKKRKDQEERKQISGLHQEMKNTLEEGGAQEWERLTAKSQGRKAIQNTEGKPEKEKRVSSGEDKEGGRGRKRIQGQKGDDLD